MNFPRPVSSDMTAELWKLRPRVLTKMGTGCMMVLMINCHWLLKVRFRLTSRRPNLRGDHVRSKPSAWPPWTLWPSLSSLLSACHSPATTEGSMSGHGCSPEENSAHHSAPPADEWSPRNTVTVNEYTGHSASQGSAHARLIYILPKSRRYQMA